jgi:hypothetical protein
MSSKSIFLIAHYYIRPRSARTQTQVKGWMKNSDNLSYDEQVAIATRLKNSDHTTAKVILDLSNKKIVRNGFQSETTFDQLFGYFLKNYPQHVAVPMSRLDPDYLTNFNNSQEQSDVSNTVSSTISSG